MRMMQMLQMWKRQVMMRPLRRQAHRQLGSVQLRQKLVREAPGGASAPDPGPNRRRHHTLHHQHPNQRNELPIIPGYTSQISRAHHNTDPKRARERHGPPAVDLNVFKRARWMRVRFECARQPYVRSHSTGHSNRIESIPLLAASPRPRD